jgi:hypothetical protein
MECNYTLMYTLYDFLQREFSEVAVGLSVSDFFYVSL